jgi:hypothetical protein
MLHSAGQQRLPSFLRNAIKKTDNGESNKVLAMLLLTVSNLIIPLSPEK